jgi:hypothetical protein
MTTYKKNPRRVEITKEDAEKGPEAIFQKMKAAGIVFDSEECPYKIRKPWYRDGDVIEQWDVDQLELHNAMARQIVPLLIGTVTNSGGDTADILVLLESVSAGVLLAVTKAGGDEPVLKAFCESLEQRVAELRLKQAKILGEA